MLPQEKKIQEMNLLYCDPDDIRFLSTILEDVKAISGDADTRSIKKKGMNTVKTILDEALGGYRDERRQDDISSDELRNATDLECGGDLEDVNDETWTEEWEFVKLCKWSDTDSIFSARISVS